MTVLPEKTLKNIRVVAFVGPAGTGKSQRVQMVARANDINYIIDDGLVISKGRIMVGKSAKAEKNLIRAIRRAVFEFPDHRQSVQDFLRKNTPDRILIVATSISMAEIICSALELPPEVRGHNGGGASRRDPQGQEKATKRIPWSRLGGARKNFAGKLVGHILDFFMTNDCEEQDRTIVTRPLPFRLPLTCQRISCAMF